MGGYMMHQQPNWGGARPAQPHGQQQQQQQQLMYQQQQQQQYQQHIQQQQLSPHYGGVAAAAAAAAGGGGGGGGGGGMMPQHHQGMIGVGHQGAYIYQQQAVVPPPQVPMQVLQVWPGRLPADQPIMKLSVGLIETYKEINKKYYEEREARKQARKAKAAAKQGVGTQNNGWDDEKDTIEHHNNNRS